MKATEPQAKIDHAAPTPKFKEGDHVWAKQPKDLVGRTGYVKSIDTYKMEYTVMFDKDMWIVPEADLEMVDPAAENAETPVFEPKEDGPRFDLHYGEPIGGKRLQQILTALFPWGYANKKDGNYIGPSPYMYDWENIIEVCVKPSYCDGAALCINLLRMDEDGDEQQLLGYYVGLMRAIAPELDSVEDSFNTSVNVLNFYYRDKGPILNTLILD